MKQCLKTKGKCCNCKRFLPGVDNAWMYWEVIQLATMRGWITTIDKIFCSQKCYKSSKHETGE